MCVGVRCLVNASPRQRDEYAESVRGSVGGTTEGAAKLLENDWVLLSMLRVVLVAGREMDVAMKGRGERGSAERLEELAGEKVEGGKSKDQMNNERRGGAGGGEREYAQQQEDITVEVRGTVVALKEPSWSLLGSLLWR